MTYDLWENLSYAIREGVVAEQKWLLSERTRYDVRTPTTIHEMIYRNPTGSDRVERTTHGVTHGNVTNFRDLLALAYLLGTDFVEEFPPVQDEHGSNQLEGELRRYWAEKNGIFQPASVELTRAIVDDYCQKYWFWHVESLAKKLNL